MGKWLAAALLLAAAAARAETLVVCAPGSPGTTDEAQPRMDAFAAAVSARAGTRIAAIYVPFEDEGASHLKGAELGLVSLPFFLKHEAELRLEPRLMAVARGRPPLDRWALVAQKGKGPALTGFTIVSSVAYAPAFVRSMVPLPADAKLVQSTAVLSSLRRAANGEPVAVLVDGAQEESLRTLPFAAKLEVVGRSPPLPVALVVTVGAKVSPRSWSAIEAALLGLAGAPLEAIQLDRFAPLDQKALDGARKAYGR